MKQKVGDVEAELQEQLITEVSHLFQNDVYGSRFYKSPEL
jgi:hypothetical protein